MQLETKYCIISFQPTLFHIKQCIWYEYTCRLSFLITGGQLGLWVGISVITLCEILGLLSQMMHYVCNWCYRSLDAERKRENTDRQANRLNHHPSESPQKVVTHFTFWGSIFCLNWFNVHEDGQYYADQRDHLFSSNKAVEWFFDRGALNVFGIIEVLIVKLPSPGLVHCMNWDLRIKCA